MEKLIILDGSSVLSTSFYAGVDNEFYKTKTEEERAPFYKKLLQTSDGKYTNGVITTCRIFENILKYQNPTHIAVCWDSTRDTFRKLLYKDYKGNRPVPPKALLDQFEYMQDIFKAMGIAQFVSSIPNNEEEMKSTYEADDYLGTIATMFEDEIPVYILTKDKDALQLCSDNTTVWLKTSKADDLLLKYNLDRRLYNIPTGVFPYNPYYFQEEFGISPKQYIDFKALLGDDSDNIPGVKGVGKVVTPLLINEYNTIENLYDNIEDLSKEEMKDLKELWKELGIKKSPINSLIKTSNNPEELTGKDSAFLSKELATIVRNIPELYDLKLSDLKLNINENGKKVIYKKYELKSIL